MTSLQDQVVDAQNVDDADDCDVMFSGVELPDFLFSAAFLHSLTVVRVACVVF